MIVKDKLIVVEKKINEIIMELGKLNNLLFDLDDETENELSSSCQSFNYMVEEGTEEIINLLNNLLSEIKYYFDESYIEPDDFDEEDEEDEEDDDDYDFDEDK